MTVSEIEKYTSSQYIKIVNLREHTKASEKYVDVIFTFPDEKIEWLGSIPYYYRRTGTFLEKPNEIADLIITVYNSFKKENRKEWIEKETRLWSKEFIGKTVTKSFFDVLLNLKWNCVDHDLPKNRNWARRVQDIKEMGYLLATNTRLYCNNCNKNTTHVLLVPYQRGPQTGYEIITPKLKKRILKVLGYYDAFEGKVKKTNSLIPDHKFPEISWDETVRQQNLERLSDEEIKQKFQLLDNQRNLEKREACRKIIQTGMRGSMYGIKYYYKGNENWPSDVPRVGKEAEKGWVGSPWYDLETWRKSLNKFIEKNQKAK